MWTFRRHHHIPGDRGEPLVGRSSWAVQGFFCECRWKLPILETVKSNPLKIRIKKSVKPALITLSVLPVEAM